MSTFALQTFLISGEQFFIIKSCSYALKIDIGALSDFANNWRI